MKTNQFFEYYHGHEADQFTFYRIPKQFFKDKSFAALSDAARILYGLLLDRMSLSARNGWIDENDHVFIIYTIEQIREDLGWGRDKAINALAELDSRKGIGLIKRVKRGHIEYVLESLARNTKQITSVKNHMLTTLYNATLTSKTSIQAEVNHDLYGENGLYSHPAEERKRRHEKPHLFCRVLLRRIWT